MIPALEDTISLISKKAVEHKVLTSNINRYVEKIKPNDTVMGIGYTSGGESIIAFDECGLQASWY